ncbi:MAG: YkgJ family cysteine cluster protein [Gammaproteobacteria bacterium]|nr:YkgJ family cysteine cluster protein [Gammaproteobacteria bacterium]MDH5800033.1 YkgJ family cysteine cluster protein [Gammaproteobacteria bacterium]
MKTIRTRMQIRLGGKQEDISLDVPNKPSKSTVTLPLLRHIVQKAEITAIESASRDGKEITCSKGCAACCRQLIAIPPTEAMYIQKLIGRLSKPRQKIIRQRFKDTKEKIHSSGLLEHVMQLSGDTDLVTVALDYFRLQIPCPFLEQECCSIYAERPLACREYLVVNPPERCANPTRETIDMLSFPVKTSRLLTELDRLWYQDNKHNAVPLSLLLYWLECHPVKPAIKHSKDWFGDVLHALSNKD